MYKREYQEGGAMRFNQPQNDMAGEVTERVEGGPQQSPEGGGGDEAAMAAGEQLETFIGIIRQIPPADAAQLLARLNQQLMEMMQGGGEQQ